MASSVDRNDNEQIITTEVQGVSRGIKKKPFTLWVKGKLFAKKKESVWQLHSFHREIIHQTANKTLLLSAIIFPITANNPLFL